MARFLNLRVWHQAETLAVLVAEAVPHLHGRGDLRAQLSSAACSVASNITEGAERVSDKDFLHFLRIADGSLAEVHAQMRLAALCGFVAQAQADRVIAQARIVGRMLNLLMTRLSGG